MITILHIEDSKSDRAIVSEILRVEQDEREIHIFSAPTLREGLAHLVAYQPRLVILDLRLPDSADAIDTLSAVISQSHAHTLVLTGAADGPLAASIRQAYNQSLVSKDELLTDGGAEAFRRSVRYLVGLDGAGHDDERETTQVIRTRARSSLHEALEATTQERRFAQIHRALEQSIEMHDRASQQRHATQLQVTEHAVRLQTQESRSAFNASEITRNRTQIATLDQRVDGIATQVATIEARDLGATERTVIAETERTKREGMSSRAKTVAAVLTLAGLIASGLLGRCAGQAAGQADNEKQTAPKGAEVAA